MKFITIISLNISLVVCISPEIQDLLTPLKEYGESCGYSSCPMIREDALNVHIVPHTHLELGFMTTFEQHYTGYDEFYARTTINVKRILDYVVTELWANNKRKFTIADMAFFFFWWSNRDDTVRRMVYTLIRQGRLTFVGGGWSMTEEATTSYQAIIDHFTYTLRKINNTFMECGRPLVAWQADVYGHSREFASLMAQMGFDGLFISPISYDDELNRMKEKSMEFVWRGSDDLGTGSDIYTHKLFDGYWPPPGFCFSSLCADPLLVYSDDNFNNIRERVDLFIKSMRSRQSINYNTNNVMVVMGMRDGYHDADLWFGNIDKLIEEVNVKSAKDGTNINLFYSSPNCYLNAVYNSNPILKTKQDDFYPMAYDKQTYTTGFFTSRPTVKYMAREGFLYLQIMKQLQVFGNLTQYKKIYEELSSIVGMFQDHTIISGALRIPVKHDYAKKMSNAIQRSLSVPQSAFNKFRGTPASTYYYRCLFNISSCRNTHRIKSIIVIYNPLAWPVTVPVRVPVMCIYYVVYNHKDERISASIIPLPKPVINLPFRNTSATHELVFIAENLPPLGYRSYYIDAKRLKKNLIKEKTSKPTLRERKSIIKKLNNRKSTYYIRQPKGKANDGISNYDINNVRKKYARIIHTKVNNASADFGSVQTPRSRVAKESVNFNGSKEEIERLSENIRNVDIYKEDSEKGIVESDIDNFKTDIINEKIKNLDLYKVEDTDISLEDPVTETLKTKIVADSRNISKCKTDDAECLNRGDNQLDEEADDAISTTTEEPYEEAITSNNTEAKYYSFFNSKNLFIKNKYVQVNIDQETRKISSMNLSNGVNITLDIQFYYYKSDDPLYYGRGMDRKPGAIVFRALDPQPVPIIEMIDTVVYKTQIVEEIHCRYADYASFSAKIYKELPMVEIDWVVGPVPLDGVGREVFVRYTTDLVNKGAFYTDSNGRQTIKRLRDMRASFQPENNDPIAGNYYPVTSKIYIEDLSKNLRFSVFNDRAQGGASLYDGEIDLMVHRRLETDDSGVQNFLNETYYLNETHPEVGIAVRGKHYLYLSKANHKPNRIFEKKFAKELELPPKVFVSTSKIGSRNAMRKSEWIQYKNEQSFLKSKLPIGIHVLSLEFWNDGTLLLRLENYLEKSDVFKAGIKTVHLKRLFLNIEIEKVKETTLGANIWLKDKAPLLWNNEKFFKSFNEAYGKEDVQYLEEEELKTPSEVDLETGVMLAPQQIKTFVVWYKYVPMNSSETYG